MIEPAKVATSPKATRTVSWITPCGAMSMPTKRRISPPMESIAAVTSCKIRSFIIILIYLLVSPFNYSDSAYILRSNSPPVRRIFAYPFAKIRLREDIC